MRSRFTFEKMMLLMLTIFLLFAFSACEGSKAVKSEPVAKDSVIMETEEVKPAPQAVKTKEGREIKPTPQAVEKEIQAVKAKDDRFIASDNGTVLDRQKNLMWAAKDNGSDISFTSAKSYCRNYRAGGYTDWRIPTQNELMGLFDASKSRPAACDRRFNIHVATELINITCVASWAAEVRGSDAAYLSFGSGRRYWGPQSSDVSSRILPVRSNK